jgi:hypothetical protein
MRQSTFFAKRETGLKSGQTTEILSLAKSSSDRQQASKAACIFS